MKDNFGTLYLVATPIGNLSDISLRAIEVLKNVDLIAAEDTRHSKILLDNYEISVPMTSYHEHNKYEKAQVIIEKLKSGLNVALITDAGTPAISDPGEVLAHMCKDEGVKVTSIPGASAVITALTLSGLSTRRFCFEGFLPAEKNERDEIIKQLVSERRTIVLYEAPHRLKKTLKRLYENLGDRKICICRELTKIHEEAELITLSEAISFYEGNEPKGEFVLVIEGKSDEEIKNEEAKKWEEMSLTEHLNFYLEKGVGKKDAMKKMALDRNVKKRDIYNALLEEEG